MDSFRVVVVDDSALFRTLLRNVLTEIPGCEVAASLGDGKIAVERIAAIRPDLVTLDLEMPGMNGIEVLRELNRRKLDSRVVMVSRFTSAGAQVTTDALIEGAFDFILKPSGKNPADNRLELRTALARVIAVLRGEPDDAADEALPPPKVAPDSSAAALPCDCIVIGCSTGGPDALARIIPDLPASLPVPVLIVQHMPERFTASLAARLNEASSLEVLEAVDGMRVRAGQAVIARGGRHLQVRRQSSGQIVLQLTEAPPEHQCRPAVDYTLRSAVETFQGRLLAVILTGMGRDGTAGCQLVRAAGGRVLAQDAEGCTVFGMPKSVIKSGLAQEVVKLPQIASTLERIAQGTSLPSGGERTRKT